jgi:two-component sensor histidine kinase
MALVHERLYQSKDFSRIDFSDYINHMAVHLMSLYHERTRNIDLDIKSQGVYLDINRAIPCALLLNEIITNALKHAFPQNRPGKLTIIMEERSQGKYYLWVEDNGVGLPPETNIENAATLGLQLISDLTVQLGGKLKVYRNQGTAFEVVF